MLFSTKNLTRLMFILIIILAFAAGYYKSSLETETKNVRLLEKKIKLLENQIDQTVETTDLDS